MNIKFLNEVKAGSVVKVLNKSGKIRNLIVKVKGNRINALIGGYNETMIECEKFERPIYIKDWQEVEVLKEGE